MADILSILCRIRVSLGSSVTPSMVRLFWQHIAVLEKIKLYELSSVFRLVNIQSEVLERFSSKRFLLYHLRVLANKLEALVRASFGF